MKKVFFRASVGYVEVFRQARGGPPTVDAGTCVAGDTLPAFFLNRHICEPWAENSINGLKFFYELGSGLFVRLVSFKYKVNLLLLRRYKQLAFLQGTFRRDSILLTFELYA